MTATTYGTGSSYIKPTNSIMVAAAPGYTIQTVRVENATNMYAGRLVMKGTTDDCAVVNTAVLTPTGWLGYEQTHKKYRPATVGTIYTVEAQAAVISGPGIVLVASLAAGQTIVKGAALKATTAGQLIAAGATDDVIAIAEESCTNASYDANIMVRSLI
jgi:hypothetical protein